MVVGRHEEFHMICKDERLERVSTNLDTLVGNGSKIYSGVNHKINKANWFYYQMSIIIVDVREIKTFTKLVILYMIIFK